MVKDYGDQVLVEQETAVAQAAKMQVARPHQPGAGSQGQFLMVLALTGKLDGKVEIIEQPGKVTRVQGELNIQEGQYVVYGQKLDIERGRLMFAGDPHQ